MSSSLLGCSRPVSYKFEWLIRTDRCEDLLNLSGLLFSFWTFDRSVGGLNIPQNSPNLEYRSHLVKISMPQRRWLGVWPRDSIAPPAGIHNSYMHIHLQNSVCTCIMTRGTQKGAWTKTVSPTGSRLFWFSPPFWRISKPCSPPTDWTPQTSHSVSLILKQILKIKDEKLSKAFSYVIPGACGGALHFDASPQNIKSLQLQHTISHLHQIAHTCRGCRPEYVYASILCHIHSATKRTQEVRQMSSDLHALLLDFSTSYTTTWHVASRRAWSEGPFIRCCYGDVEHQQLFVAVASTTTEQKISLIKLHRLR